MTDAGAVLASDVGTKLLAIHDALDQAGIPHAFGGAVALAYAVPHPRATNDIDINIAASIADAGRVLAALPEGVEGRPDTLARITSDGQDRLRWGDVPVDVFFPQHDFHGVVAARTLRQPFRNRIIPVITATDLTVFKSLFNRRKDWPDIEAMLQAGSVDAAEATRWVREIVGADHPSYTTLVALIDEVRGAPPAERDGDPQVWKPLR